MATTSSTPNIIDYFGRDFDAIRTNLINYALTRHADRFAYLNDASPDMLYLELVAYTGDVLGYQLDRAFLEGFRLTAQNKESLVRIAQDLGFFDYGAKPSSLQANISIQVPATTNSDGTAMIPDPNYLITLFSGLKVQSTNNQFFECLDEINFSDASSRVIIPNYDGNNRLINFTVQKTVVFTAGETKVQRFFVSSQNSKPFLEVLINDTLVTQIIGIVPVAGDSYDVPDDQTFRDINVSYVEVENLANDKIFVPINDSSVTLNSIIDLYTDMTINYGDWVNVSKRFIVRKDKNDQTSVIFGSTLVDYSYWSQAISGTDVNTLATFSLNQILNNLALGEIPAANTTLFIKYRTGAGIDTDIPTATTLQIIDKRFVVPPVSANLSILQQVRNSLSVVSNTPAVGGRDFMTSEEIRQSASKVFAANDRAVTYEDVKALINTMPAQFGTPFRISYEEIKPKVLSYNQVNNYVSSKLDELLYLQSSYDREQSVANIKSFLTGLVSNQVAIEQGTGISFKQSSNDIINNTPSLWVGEKCRLYILGIDSSSQPLSYYKDSNGIIKSANTLLKTNIKNYLIEKRLIGDWIDILDARVVNFQVSFKIIADKKNKQKVLVDCLTKLRDYFNVFNWQLNQSIYINNVATILQQIEGVINVVELKFINVFGTDLDSGIVYAPAETGRYRNNKTTSLNSYNNKFEMNNVNNVIVSYPDTFLSILAPESDIFGSVVNTNT